MNDPFPGLPCDRQDCRISGGTTRSTLIHWEPIYNRQGERLDDGDPNTTFGEVRCFTCGRSYSYSTRRGVTRWATDVAEKTSRPVD